MTTKTKAVTSLVAAALLVASCGDRSSGPSPSKVTITAIKVAAGGTSPTFSSGPLNSDVRTNGSIVDDLAEVSMGLVLKDPGVPGNEVKPSALNAVTFTRYHVEYRRADGRNAPGVDVPWGFDSAQTFTVTDEGNSAVIEVVRHIAKAEAPLAALISDVDVITAIATVTFYGQDQGGNNVKVSADIQVNFANFADPT